MEGSVQTPGSESAPGPSPQPAPAPSAPQPFSPPAGHRLVRDEEWNSYQSSSALAKRAGELGIKSPDDLGRYGGLLQALSKNGMDPMVLAAALSGQREEAEPDALKGFDPEAYKAELRADHDRRWAEREHDEAFRGQEKWLAEAMNEVIGSDELSDEEKELNRLALMGSLHEARAKDIKPWMYPEGHALRDSRLAPFNATNSAQVLAAFKELRGKVKGSVLAGIGDRANKKPVPTAGGRTTGGGKPSRGSGDPVDDMLRKMADQVAV